MGILKSKPLIRRFVLFIPAILLICSCSSNSFIWPHPTKNIDVNIVGPIYVEKNDSTYFFPMLLNQAISDLIVNQSKLTPQQTKGRVLKINHKNWLLKQKEVQDTWYQIQLSSRLKDGSYDNMKLKEILGSPNVDKPEYILGIHIVPPVSPEPDVLILEGYRLIRFSEDEIEANMFKTSVSIKGKNTNTELKNSILQLILTNDFSTPGFGSLGFIKIEGGCFQAGNINQREECVDDFSISKFLITQNQWISIMGKNPSLNKIDGTFPVENVSWNSIQLFIDKLNDITDLEFRLPTELEWEYACRNRGNPVKFGTKTGKISYDLANYFGTSSFDIWSGTSPTGAFPPNQLGLFDMAGNTWEWTRDIYSEKENMGFIGTFITELTKDVTRRTIRGGSFDSLPGELQCTSRNFVLSSISSADIGFRLALED